MFISGFLPIDPRDGGNWEPPNLSSVRSDDVHRGSVGYTIRPPSFIPRVHFELAGDRRDEGGGRCL